MSDTVSRQNVIGALLEKGQRSRRYKLGEIWELNFDEIREALATVPSAEPHWIPCGERLPEKNGYYLTTTCYRQVYCDFWNKDNFDRTEMVIAWMPLPKPYEGDKK